MIATAAALTIAFASQSDRAPFVLERAGTGSALRGVVAVLRVVDGGAAVRAGGAAAAGPGATFVDDVATSRWASPWAWRRSARRERSASVRDYERRDIHIVGLPEAFDGFRVAQISDLHCGPFADGARVASWVAEVNRLAPDLIAVTGDLIARGDKFVPVVAAELGELRARAGVFASMGNHDYFTDGDALAAAVEGAGLTMLRNRGVEVSHGDGRIFVAGVDDTWTRRQDFDRALAKRPDGMTTVLLAHDPTLFPEAAARGVDLTLSGHLHGGQLGLPFLAGKVNLARLLTRFTTGFYRLGNASLT